MACHVHRLFQIFRSRYKYNIAVRQSTYPALNNYIRSVLSTLLPSFKKRAVQSVSVNILQNGIIQETYTMQLSFPPTPPTPAPTSQNQFFVTCREVFRSQIVALLNCGRHNPSKSDDGISFEIAIKHSDDADIRETNWVSSDRTENNTARITSLLFNDGQQFRIQTLLTR